MEQLRERSRVERKETISKSSTRTRKEYMRNQVGKNGENVEAKVETYTETAAVRQNQQERKERNRRLSSRKWNGSGRKKVEGKWKIRKVRTRSMHLRNGCGSETGKDERKHTAKLSTRTGKEGMRNQAGENGENGRSESGRRALK